MSKLKRVFLPFFIASIIVILGINPVLSERLQGIPLRIPKDKMYLGEVGKNIFKFDTSKGVWRKITDIFRRKPDAGGSHGDQFCWISPDPNNPLVSTSWSLEPVFIWEGDIQSIWVSTDNPDDIVWKRNLTDSEKLQGYAKYDSAVPLEHRAIYSVQVSDQPLESAARQNSRSIRFETVPKAVYDTIDVALNQYLANNISNTLPELEREETELLLRAEFFESSPVVVAQASSAQRSRLWMDVMREALALDIPEENYRSIREAMTKTCGSTTDSLQ